MSFRVQELQQLMSMCSRSRVGRKQELLSRALYLVKNSADGPKVCKVAQAIRDLYNRRYPSRQITLNGSETAANQEVETSSKASTRSSTNSFNGETTPRVDYNEESLGNKQVPVLPDVTFKDLPFYEELDVLIKPTSLVDHGPGRYQETTLPFYLSQRQVQAIYDSRTMMSMQGGNIMSYSYTVQIQVRLCLLETSCEQADHLPAFCALKVNGNSAFSFQEPQSSNVKRPPSNPVDITGHCRLSSSYPNVLSVTWASNYGQRHCIVVRLVRQLTSQILLDRMKKHVRNIDHSKALIREKLSCDDNEIATTSLRVSLLCPLSKARIQIPCRPTTCNHLQCFDASTFLQMNERKATWVCPVCDASAKYISLAIDAFFNQCLTQCTESDEIEVYPDGNWQPLNAIKQEPQQTEVQSTSSTSRPEAISVDSPQGQEEQPARPESPPHDVIDILSSDDDDEAPPPKRQAVQPVSSPIKSAPKPAAPKQTVIQQPTDPALAGFESLMSGLYQSGLPDADPSFTNFIRELNKMRQSMRHPSESSSQPPPAPTRTKDSSSENIITID